MIKKRLLTTLFVIFLVLTVAGISATADSNKAKADLLVMLTIEVNGDGYTDPPSGQNVIDADLLVTLTIEVNGDGYTDPPSGQYVTDIEGSMVTITAYPNSGWQFDGWDGDVADPNSAITTVLVDYSTTVIANFSATTPPTTTTTPPTTTTTTPTPDDEEASLNMWVVIGAVLGVLVVGGVVYYVRR